MLGFTLYVEELRVILDIQLISYITIFHGLLRPPSKKAKIEHTAQAILDARSKYPDCSLADLYDEVSMPPELRKAHQANDRAVMQAYGFDVKSMTESTCVSELMKMYQKLTK